MATYVFIWTPSLGVIVALKYCQKGNDFQKLDFYTPPTELANNSLVTSNSHGKIILTTLKTD